MLHKKGHSTTLSSSAKYGGQAPLSGVSNKVCEWGAYVTATGAHKICTSTTSAVTTSTAVATLCWETCKDGDQELGDGWLYCLCLLVGCVALHGECSELLLHCLLVDCELVDADISAAVCAVC
jgi:hypothetical protein